jgi:hypothetical protein
MGMAADGRYYGVNEWTLHYFNKREDKIRTVLHEIQQFLV